jgi:hypothetical protein
LVVNFSFDHERLELVLSRLLQRLEAGQFPYEKPLLPQDHASTGPTFPYGSDEHARWLFCLCYYMRGGTPSVAAAQSLGRLWRRRPGLFDFEKAALVSPKSIKRSFESLDMHFLKNWVSIYWPENAHRMVRLWSGDPRKIFAGVSDYEEACARVKNDKKGGGFWGFQEKMVSMLLYFLMDEGLIEFFNFPLPVDFHVLRVAVSNEIVQFEGGTPAMVNLLSNELLEALRQGFEEFAAAHQISPLRMADAIWLLSQTLCRRNPGNQVNQGSYQARSTKLTPYQPTWTTLQQQAFEATCGRCPLNDTCVSNIGSAYYYRRGHLVVMRQRLKPPAWQPQLI